MKKTVIALVMLALFYVSAVVSAQTPAGAPAAQTPPVTDPLSAEVKGAYNNIKNNFVKSAEKMPEDQYGFKASPEIQTFAQRVAHIADSNMRTCAAMKGEQKNLNAAAKTTKADLVAAIKESFTYCDTVFASLTDAEALKIVPTGRGQSSRIGALWRLVVHDNEVYGAMGVYMRLKGIVPPSSEGR